MIELLDAMSKNVDIGNLIIKPSGKNLKSINSQKNYNNKITNKFYVPVYHNETILLNLSEKLKSLNIDNECKRFSHISDLLQYQGVICIPYAWSTLTFFEMLQLGLITFIPTERFLIELFKTGYYWFQPPFNINNPGLLKLSEWYCNEHKDILVFFDSWDDLQIKIKTTDYEEKTKTILNFAKKHHDNTLTLWNNIINNYNINK